jgi:hypothetical protein
MESAVQCKHGMNTFVYPPIEDIALVKEADIVLTLSQPKVVRYVLHFPNDLFVFSVMR